MSRRTPWLTISTGTITAVVSVVGLGDHDVIRDLARRGGELAAGEPWRLVTSLLVHDTWLALVANLVFLGLVGTAVERRRSRGEWLTLYLVAGVVGELVGTEWQPHGAGNSVALMGLVGCLAVTALRRGEAPFLALGYSAIVLVTLLGADVGGAAGVVIVVIAYLVPGACFAANARWTRAATGPRAIPRRDGLRPGAGAHRGGEPPRSAGVHRRAHRACLERTAVQGPSLRTNCAAAAPRMSTSRMTIMIVVPRLTVRSGR